MKETQVPLAHAANLVANSDSAFYGVESITDLFNDLNILYWWTKSENIHVCYQTKHLIFMHKSFINMIVLMRIIRWE